MPSRNISYLPALDHLRAFAAVLVIAYHSHEGLAPTVAANDCRGPLWSLLIQGHSGVALFIVLSGFVFSYGAQGLQIDYWKFLYNRVLRVFPLFVFLLLLTFSIYRGSYTSFSLLQSLLTLGNLPGAASYGNVVSSISWTLSPEFQFYLLFPFLLMALDSPRKWSWFVAVCAFLLVIRFVGYAANKSYTDAIYWTILGRLPQFLTGMLAARLYRSLRARPVLLRWCFPVAVTAILALHEYMRTTSVTPLWSSSVDVLQGLAWAALILTYIPVAPLLPGLLALPLAFLGTISYSLYMMHYCLVTSLNRQQFHTRFVPDPHWNSLLIIALIYLHIVIVCAKLTYEVVEKPFLSMRVRYLSTSTTTS